MQNVQNQMCNAVTVSILTSFKNLIENPKSTDTEAAHKLYPICMIMVLNRLAFAAPL